ncbi:hypothetical protein H0H87_009764 [Tephrocybe sp. NHM501043]|nr:hypothetical protein H0H87_009764 [Tephrocybe sp. NHM501043]
MLGFPGAPADVHSMRLAPDDSQVVTPAQRSSRKRKHVKALESRSQLLDAALSSADEANRRWEECRVLLDQLRVENAALRAALSQSQIIPQLPPNPAAQPSQNSQQEKTDQQQLEEATRSLEAVVHNELKGAEAQHQQQNTD